MRRKYQLGTALLLVLAILSVACGSTKSKTASGSSTTGSGSSGTTGGVPAATGLGPGVTATTVKLGVPLVDFNCIKPFVDSVRVQQQQTYQLYIDNINAHGGLAGRQIQPVYETYCPIGNTQALAQCTKLTEDDKVFAVVGTFVDFSGDAQTCLTKNHHTPLLTFELTRAVINQSPPGLIIFAGATPERTDTVLVDLLKKEHTLNGKKIAILGETTSQDVVTSSVEPALKTLGIPMGSTAILNITGSDTTAAQSQLDSFIERWKSEHVTALFVSGAQVSSQQFIEKVKAGMPNVQLVTDNTDTLGFGQQENQAGRKPNPYEGILTSVGPTGPEYTASANWKYCASVYQQRTGKVPPNVETVQPKGPDGKTQDLYGVISDSCQLLTLLQEIGNKVGKNLNAETWANTVNSYGAIRDVGGGQFNSIHTGKYDDFDTFRLAAFDSSLPPNGNWRAMTPLQNIPG